jgi:hypothetical protein
MRYLDLPTRDVVTKLSSYAFARSGVDASVFKFYTGTEQVYQFVTNQIAKAREQNADNEKFRNAALEILQKEIEFDLPKLDICEDDFVDENCRRSDDKAFWLSAIERLAILNLVKLSAEIIDG